MKYESYGIRYKNICQLSNYVAVHLYFKNLQFNSLMGAIKEIPQKETSKLM